VGRSDVVLIPHLLELEPDFVGQSFVRSADDIRELRARLPERMRIVAKIETRPAVERIAAILEVADAIMVARGDLGVELPFEQVPLVQKDLVRAALAAGRPSIVATQMLESMVEAPRPTRAEASDVANAVLDGADAVMLSGETAIGAWPVEALRAAASICAATDVHQAPSRPPLVTPAFEVDPDARAVGVAAIAMVDADPDVVGIACYTRSGRTARLLSALRPHVPIVAFTSTAACARSLSLRRGVQPVVLDVDDDDPGAIAKAVTEALAGGVAGAESSAGKAVVLVQTSSAGGTNSLEVLRP
jgi:pyruvate kinase